MTRRAQELFQERWDHSYDHAALTATTTVKRFKVPAGKKLRIDRISYINPTGLAGDGTNAFKLEVKKDATLIAEVFNTDTNDDPAGAALAADTFVEVTPSASLAVLDAGAILTVVFTEDGIATLPAGTLIFEGRYL